MSNYFNNGCFVIITRCENLNCTLDIFHTFFTQEYNIFGPVLCTAARRKLLLWQSSGPFQLLLEAVICRPRLGNLTRFDRDGLLPNCRQNNKNHASCGHNLKRYHTNFGYKYYYCTKFKEIKKNRWKGGWDDVYVISGNIVHYTNDLLY